MEVVYLRGDGAIVRTYAYLSQRTLGGRWMVGDAPLDDVAGTILYRGPRLNDEGFSAVVDQLRPAGTP